MSDLAGIDGDLAWHSGTYDHALDHDAAGWYCRTCRDAILAAFDVTQSEIDALPDTAASVQARADAAHFRDVVLPARIAEIEAEMAEVWPDQGNGVGPNLTGAGNQPAARPGPA